MKSALKARNSKAQGEDAKRPKPWVAAKKIKVVDVIHMIMSMNIHL